MTSRRAPPVDMRNRGQRRRRRPRGMTIRRAPPVDDGIAGFAREDAPAHRGPAAAVPDAARRGR